MAKNDDLEAKILRYHFVEKWRVGTIAKQLGAHHCVVDRVISQAGMPKVERSPRPSTPICLLSLRSWPYTPSSVPPVCTAWLKNGVIPVNQACFVNVLTSSQAQTTTRSLFAPQNPAR